MKRPSQDSPVRWYHFSLHPRKVGPWFVPGYAGFKVGWFSIQFGWKHGNRTN